MTLLISCRLGFYRMYPISEDIPNAATPTNTARFFLRPFNYFDADPSINSTGAVFIKPSTDKSGSGPPVVASRVDHGNRNLRLKNAFNSYY